MLKDDDAQPPIATVIASLASRSMGEKQALLQALLTGDQLEPGAGAVSGLELTSAENKAKAHFMHPQSVFDPDTHPVSGTSFPKIVEEQSFNARSPDDCDTRLSPRPHGKQTLTSLNRSIKSKQNRLRLTCQPDPTIRKDATDRVWDS